MSHLLETAMTMLANTETLLLGPGPSNVPAAVRETLAQPILGHLDPRFLRHCRDRR